MSWDTAEHDCLPADEARGKLFDEILEQLAACDLFSNTALGQPTIFPVYAHDNEDVGTAHDACVHDLISWLQRIKAGILSDKSALPPLTSDRDDTSPQRNIVANQIRLLPHLGDATSDEAVACIDKVIVCGSEVLERYCGTPYASRYIDNAMKICNTSDSLSMKTLKSRIEDFVHDQAGKDGQHHVLTEIAFLRLRKSRLPDRHGMVPVALDGAHHLPYLSVFEDSDITFKLKSTSAADKHALFFRLLEQLFVEHKDITNDFRNCYKRVVEDLKLNQDPGGNHEVDQTHFHNCLCSNMTKTYHSHWSTFSTAMRNRRFKEYAGILGQHVLNILDENKAKERREILRWVSPTGAHPMPGKYQEGRAKRLDGTCDWLIKDEKFVQWYSSETSAILSLQGRMGIGKTHATSRVIEWIQRSLGKTQRQKALAYFYCIEQDETRSTAMAVMRNIVRQIATGPGEGVTLNEALIEKWKQHGHTDQRYDTSSFDEWETCLYRLISKTHGTTIVLDALDECKSAQRTHLTKLFTYLAERCSNFKIFVSSRPEPDLTRWLDEQISISMHNGRTSGDIAAFVQDKIAKHGEWPHIDHGLKRLMINTLVNKSQGLFLCAHLQIENLQNCLYEDDIRNGLENLPRRLTKLYEKLYLRATAKPAEKRFRDRALRWVLCSLKPLTSDELLFAISQDAQADRLTKTRSDVSERLILKSCHNFLILDSSYIEDKPHRGREKAPSAPVWRLAHQAVAEFFENSASCTEEGAIMHYEAGKVCLMISLNTFNIFAVEGTKRHDLECPCQEGLMSTKGQHVGLKEPLVEYAIHAWPTHVRTYEHQEFQVNDRLSQMLLRFLHETEDGCLIYERWLEHATGVARGVAEPLPWSVVFQRGLDRMSRGSKMGCLSLVCYLGFSQTLSEFLAPAGLGMATLYDAQRWSPWRKRGRDGSDRWTNSLQGVESQRWSAVALACAHDEVKVLQCLLSAKFPAPLDTYIANEVPPLVAAAFGDSVEVVRELLRPHHDISIGSRFTSRHGNVLRFAILGDSFRVLPLLLDRLLRDSSTSKTALSSVRSSDFRWTNALSFLIENCADVNTPLHDGTLLAVAAYKGKEVLVEELLKKGANVNMEFQCLKIMEADSESHDGIVGPLDDSKWDIQNALEACLCNGAHASIARLLVNRGASVSAQAIAIVANQIL